VEADPAGRGQVIVPFQLSVMVPDPAGKFPSDMPVTEIVVDPSVAVTRTLLPFQVYVLPETVPVPGFIEILSRVAIF
jgi:hypothetical protein